MRVIPVTLRVATAVAGLMALGALAPAELLGQTASQVVTFEVKPISQIAVDGGPVFTIHYARTANASANVSTGGASWAVTTNLDGAKVTAHLESQLPSGLSLSMSLGAPQGATSEGYQTIGTVPVELVTNISRLAARDLPVAYRLEAAASPQGVTGDCRVIFTITAGM